MTGKAILVCLPLSDVPIEIDGEQRAIDKCRECGRKVWICLSSTLDKGPREARPVCIPCYEEKYRNQALTIVLTPSEIRRRGD